MLLLAHNLPADVVELCLADAAAAAASTGDDTADSDLEAAPPRLDGELVFMPEFRRSLGVGLFPISATRLLSVLERSWYDVTNYWALPGAAERHTGAVPTLCPGHDLDDLEIIVATNGRNSQVIAIFFDLDLLVFWGAYYGPQCAITLLSISSGAFLEQRNVAGTVPYTKAGISLPSRHLFAAAMDDSNMKDPLIGVFRVVDQVDADGSHLRHVADLRLDEQPHTMEAILTPLAFAFDGDALIAVTAAIPSTDPPELVVFDGLHSFPGCSVPEGNIQPVIDSVTLTPVASLRVALPLPLGLSSEYDFFRPFWTASVSESSHLVCLSLGMEDTTRALYVLYRIDIDSLFTEQGPQIVWSCELPSDLGEGAHFHPNLALASSSYVVLQGDALAIIDTRDGAILHFEKPALGGPTLALTNIAVDSAPQAGPPQIAFLLDRKGYLRAMPETACCRVGVTTISAILASCISALETVEVVAPSDAIGDGSGRLARDLRLVDGRIFISWNGSIHISVIEQ